MALIFNHPMFYNDKWHIECTETIQVSEQLSKVKNAYFITVSTLEEDASVQEVETAATSIINTTN